MSKNHDDFHYYHFSYINYLNTNEFILGVGHLNHGFRTPSSIFYLNSTFYLPNLTFYTFNFGSALFFLFSNILLFNKIKFNLQIEDNYFIVIFSTLSFCLINVFFSRLSEHGTDFSAQILILILFLELLIFFNNKNYLPNNISNIIILLALIFSLKSFYILYFIFFPIIFFYLYFENKLSIKNILFLFFKNFYFYLFLLTLLLVLIIYFINTGCFIYPLAVSCIDFLPWTISIQEVNEMKKWYELWSKGGAGPNFRVSNPELYINNFNWLGNWIKVYFFTKVSDFILGLFSLSLLAYLTFTIKIEKKHVSKLNYIYLIFPILLLLFEWFYQHPALRYGGYCLVAGPVLIFLTNKILRYRTKYIFLKKRIIFLFLITIFIFLFKNTNRILNEYHKYDYNPFVNVNYKITDADFEILNELEILKKNMLNCSDLMANCDKDVRGYVMSRFNNRFIIKKND